MTEALAQATSGHSETTPQQRMMKTTLIEKEWTG